MSAPAPDLLAEVAQLAPAGIRVRPLPELGAVEVLVTGDPPVRLILGIEPAADLALRLVGASAAAKRRRLGP
jgi:hypothetical protein